MKVKNCSQAQNATKIDSLVGWILNSVKKIILFLVLILEC